MRICEYFLDLFQLNIFCMLCLHIANEFHSSEHNLRPLSLWKSIHEHAKLFHECLNLIAKFPDISIENFNFNCISMWFCAYVNPYFRCSKVTSILNCSYIWRRTPIYSISYASGSPSTNIERHFSNWDMNVMSHHRTMHILGRYCCRLLCFHVNMALNFAFICLASYYITWFNFFKL